MSALSELKIKAGDLHKQIANPTLKKIEAEITALVPKEHIEEFYQVIIAADTMMFSEDSHQNMELVKNPESRKTPIETISTGVAGILNLINIQKDKKISVQALVYGGIVVICAALDFYERGFKIPISDEVIAETVKRANEKLFTKLGITPQMLHKQIMSGHAEIKQFYDQQAHINKKVDGLKSQKVGTK